MTILEFASHLRTRDIKLWAEGEQLRFSAPKGALTPELRSELTARKAEVLALLRDASRDERRKPPIVRVERRGSSPLSYAQQRLWFLEQLTPGTSTYNMPYCVRLRGALSTTALGRALNEIVRRHESLRSVFPETEGAPSQLVRDFAPIALPLVDLEHLPEGERESAAMRRASEEAEKPFDIATEPLFRPLVIRLAGGDHLLLLTMHHIVSDGWSIGVLMRELTALYRAFHDNQPSPIDELPVQYADFACWQREWLHGELLEEQLAYWMKHLSGPLPVLILPADRPRPAVKTHNGAVLSQDISDELAGALKALGLREGVTPFTVLLAAFQALLHRYSGQEDILVGFPVAGRSQKELEGLIGFFVNMLPLRTDFSGDPTFRDLLHRVHNGTLDAMAHQDVPFEMLVDRLQPHRDPSHSPIFQVAFAHQGSLFSLCAELPRLTITSADIERRTAKFDLMLATAEMPEGLVVEAEYNTDLFDESTIARLLEHYRAMLEGIVADSNCRLSELNLLPEMERVKLLVEWNDTRTAYPRDASIQRLFEEQVERTPDAVAVSYDTASLTYRELNERANQLARYLRRQGVGPDSLVGLYMERSLEMIVAILGILKAGGAYVPFDPAYPRGRIEFMIKDTRTPVLIVHPRLQERLPEHDAHVLCLDSDFGAIADESTENTRVSGDATNLAYVIYTSGSTGIPKGVAVPHRAVVRLVRNTDFAQLTASDRVAQVSNSSFDAATFEIWGALLNGGQLVGITKDVALSPQAFAKQLIDERISAIFLTVALFNQLAREAPHAFATVRHFMFGGEAADPMSVREVLRNGPPERLINGYGPTENTTFTACHVITALPEAATNVPIGRPIANTQIYVLDRRMNPVPAGAPGELYTGGDGLARCYLNRPALTAEHFVPNPFEDGPGGRLYKTGDLVRYRPDGVIEYLGRIDHQVKIRGFRIELGEIEAALAAHPGVRECVVLARQDVGEKRLVAYVVPESRQGPTAGDMRGFLKAKLPDYMVPAAYVVLDVLPLTSNGKVDRAVLPVPDSANAPCASADLAAPHTPVEEVLSGIWADVLNHDRIGIHDSFFDLGGHSLMATQVMSRVRRALGVELPLRVLFDTPTVAGLASAVEAAMRAGGGSEALPMLPAARDAELPLSFAQRRLWFLDQWESGSPFYNIPLALRLTGSLDAEVLERSLKEIIRRHESLRTTFAVAGETPRQAIASAVDFSLPVLDLADLAEEECEREVKRLASEESRRPFDLTRGPLIRAQLIRTRSNEHFLLLTMHHIVGDGWSLGVLFRELETLYGVFRRGEESPLAELAIQYADFAVWQRKWLSGEVLDRHVAYWKEKLGGGLPTLELPSDRPRLAVQSFRGAHFPFSVSQQTSESLRSLCRREGVTLFMTLLGAFQVLLHRYARQDDIVVGSPISNRTREEIEPLIGFFVNTLILRTDLSGDPSFTDLLARVREAALGAYAHQELPFERLVEEIHPDRDMSHTPLFQVMFALQNASRSPLTLSGLALEVIGVDSGTSKFDLTLAMAETDTGMEANFEYNTDLFDERTIERLARNFQTLIGEIVANPARRISELPLVAEAERRRTLVEWNETRSAYDSYASIHELVESQAERTPDAVAVVFGDQELTYRELNARANRLAHYLRECGVGTDDLVGVCIERSVEMVVGLLGILKAGGAYVPFDPAYPRDRLIFMLADARVRLLVTQRKLLSLFPELDARAVCVDETMDRLARQPETNPIKVSGADNLAYVIYTSGSTGQPKGVALTHRTLTNLVSWQLANFTSAPKARTLQFAPPSFDVSCQEIFSTWIAGGTLVLIPEETRRDGWALLRFLCDERIERIFVPYVAVQQLADLVVAGGPVPARLREVITAGEQLLTTKAIADFFTALDQCRLVNQYGPSEAHVVTAFVLDGAPRDWSKLPPIGRPIANTRILLLDKRLEPVPIGVPGELYIGGDGLARGYLNRPDATAERFVPDPFAHEKGARLYRTGDLARYLADGTIEFLGRIDHQVKVRGFRIELGEIEIALESCHGVREAVVVLREDSPSVKRLVAYIVPDDGAELVTDHVRSHLKEKLPEYMVPSAIVVMASLPLTPSGKVDRRSLPPPDSMECDGGPGEAPRTPVEEVLCSIWASVLHVEKVGTSENFFDLGGHSLLATQVISRVRSAFGVEMPLRRMFETPTVAGLAAAIDAALRAGETLKTPPLRRTSRDGEPALPLSFAQQRLWYLNQLEPDSASYNLPSPVRLRGKLQVEALQKALTEIVRRHESLRTRFGWSNRMPVQIIDAPSVVLLPLLDLSAVDEPKREGEAVRIAQEEAERPFKLSDGRLIRARLLRLNDDDHVLLLTMHHIVSDAWSLGVLFRELGSLYEAYSQGAPSPLPELPIQYADYAIWLRDWLKGETLDKELDYWKQRLGGRLPILDLPTDHPRPKMMTLRGRVRSRMLSKELSSALDALCRREAVTPFMVLLAAFKTLLLRYTGLEDVLVGTPVANRNRVELEQLLGFFVNTLVLRTDLSGGPTFRELLHRVREVTLGCYAHQEVPFEKIVETLQPERDPGRNPIFQVMFALQNAPESSWNLSSVSVEPFEYDSTIAHFDLSLVLSKPDGRYGAWLEYNTSLFAEETMDRVLGHFECLLAGAVQSPDSQLLELPLLQSDQGESLATRMAAVEAAVRKQQAVKECVVLADEMAPASQRFVAYVVSDEVLMPIDAQLEGVSIVPLSTLPLTSEGRVDRMNLLRTMRSSRAAAAAHRPGESTLPHAGVQDRRSELAARRAKLPAARSGAGSETTARWSVSREEHLNRQASLEARRSRLSTAQQELLRKRFRGQVDGVSASSACLVEIQPKGTKRPFFCVHPLGGDVLCFFPLSRYIGPDQPLYALQSQGIQDDAAPLLRIEEMAARYIREILAVQPVGPHLIGGWSFGGLVAFEMARQLREQGRPVALLAILDTTPGLMPEQVRETRSADAYEDNRAWLLSIALYIEGLWGRRLEVVESELQRRSPEEQMAYFTDRLRNSGLMSSNATLPQLRRLLNVFKSNSRAWCAYVTQPYEGRITLFRSQDDVAAQNAGSEPCAADVTLGWQRFSQTPVEILTAPGTHLTMLAEPNVAVLAQQLNACFERAQALDRQPMEEL